jgi:RNA polymerase sigma-70 factor (ECF subfamily)
VQGQNRIDAVLAQAAWVSRLTRALVHDQHLAEDLAQEVLARALKPEGQLRAREPGPLRAWLATTARRLANRTLRRERLRPEVEARERHGELAPAETAACLELHSRLLAAIEALDEPYREAVVLRFVQEVPIDELARRIGTTPEAARQRVSRGVRRLRERLVRGPGGRDAWLSALVATGIGREALGVGAMGTKKLAFAATLIGLAGAGAFLAFASDDGPSKLRADHGAPQIVESDSAARRHTAARADSQRLATPIDESSSTRAMNEARAIEVTDTSGRPIAAAKVLFESNGELSEFTTADDGRAELSPAPSPESGVFAHAPGFAPGRADIGAKRIALHELVDFRARIVEDLNPPESPLTLRLDPVADFSARWPESVRARMGDALDAWRKRSATTGPGGEFVFRGVASGWRGTLTLPSTHVLLDVAHLDGAEPESSEHRRESRLTLTSPRARGEVHVRRLPVVRGRFVRAGDGAPAAGPALGVHIWVRFEGGSHSPMTGAPCDDRGAFEIGLVDSQRSAGRVGREERSARVEHVIVDYFGGAAGELPARFERSLSPALATVDLGEIRVEAGRNVHFLVVDREGRPVVGARAAGPNSQTRSSTDENGRGVLLGVSPGAAVLEVGARGYSIARVVVQPEGGSASAPVIATLEKGPMLEFQLEAPRETDYERWSARIESRAELWAGSNSSGPAKLHRLVSPKFLAGAWGRDSGSTLVQFDSSGRVTLACVAPGVEVRLEVSNEVQTYLHEATVPGLGPTEHRVVPIAIESPPFALRGRVLDLDGAPLDFASVSVHGERTRGKAVSDPDGRFEIDGYVREGDLVDVLVALGGYATARVSGIELTRELEPLEVRLQAGIELRATIVEADGAPVPDLRLVASAEGFADVAARALENGRYEFASIAPRTLTLWTERSGRRFDWLRDATAQELVLTLPAHGALQVEIDSASVRWDIERWAGVRISSLEGAPVSYDVYPELAENDPTQGGLATAPATPLLPSRYRVELLLGASGSLEPQPSGLGANVEIRAGELARVRLGG